MKQFRITSENILGKSGSDCVLDKNDPVWKMMGKDAPKNLGKHLTNVESVHIKDSKNEKT